MKIGTPLFIINSQYNALGLQLIGIKPIFSILVGSREFRWGLDYFGSLEFCTHKNRLLPTSNYCQRQNKHNGQISWTNVFREEFEIIKTKGTM